MPSYNTIGQPDEAKLDNIQSAHNGPQAEIEGHQYPSEGEPPKLAPAAPKPDHWANIPTALRERSQWCLAGPGKIPLTATGHAASPTNPATWCDFDTACAEAEAKGLGIGFVLSESDPFTCIDMDVKDIESRDKEGKPYPGGKWTSSYDLEFYSGILQFADSYAELSSSGKGLHVWVRGDVGSGRRAKGIEVYSRERFMVCTGIPVSDIKYQIRNNVVVPHLYEVKQKEVADGSLILQNLTQELGEAAYFIELEEVASELTDGKVWLQAASANNGDKFKALCEGNWQAYDFPSQSEADLALMSMFTFYSKSNAQCRRMFRQTALGQRDKATKNDVYLNRTLKIIRGRQAKEQDSHAHGAMAAKELLAKYDEDRAKEAARQKARAESRIKVYSAAELMKRPPVRWRISGILPEEGFAALFGPPASGKSFLTLDMLAHIASGQQWFGHRVRQAPVAYVAFEGAHGVPQRLQAFSSEHWTPDHICFIEAPTISLVEPSDRDALIDVLRQHLQTSGVLCIDTLAASAPGIDENSSEGMGKLISELQAIQHEVGGCILVVHHTGKDRDRGLRGWSGLNGALDAAIEVSREGSGSRSWKLSKAKDGKDGVGAPFDLKPVLLEHDEDGEPISSCVVVTAAIQDKVDHAALSDADDEFVWGWVKKEVDAGEHPSKDSLKGQLSKMKQHSDITQERLRTAVRRLMEANRLANAATRSPSGNIWIRAVERPGSLASGGSIGVR